MSSPEDRDIEPFDWFNRFFGSGSSRRSGGLFGFPDIFRGFDDMRREMERGFENAFKNIQVQALFYEQMKPMIHHQNPFTKCLKPSTSEYYT